MLCEPDLQQDLIMLLEDVSFNCKGGSRLGVSATWGDASGHKIAFVINGTACALVVLAPSTDTVLRPSTLEHALLDHTTALLPQWLTLPVPVVAS